MNLDHSHLTLVYLGPTKIPAYMMMPDHVTDSDDDEEGPPWDCDGCYSIGDFDFDDEEGDDDE